MNYKGETVLLDNFRTLFYDYSIDIQDIIRSAILDDVDILDYIDICKDNPYKLDQIRLSKKENLSNELYKISSGDILYRIRKLNQRGINLSYIERQLSLGSLSEEYIQYMLTWVAEGINVSNLNISIIPRDLLDTFDYGLRSGFSMKEFNNGIVYSPEYIKLCLKILKDNKSISFLLDGDFSIEVVRALACSSKMEGKKWKELVHNISSDINEERVVILIKLVNLGILLKDLQKKTKSGSYVYSYDCLDIVYMACMRKLNYKVLIEKTTDPLKMRSMVEEMELEVNREKGVRLRGY